MEKNGYSIRTFNVCDFSKSMHFNPFIYFTSVSDVRSFVEILMANTKGEGEKSGEDFWVKAERLWFMSHIAYLMETLPKEEVNIPKLLDMLTSSQTKEEGDDFTNPVDILFEDLEQENPRSFAVQLYHNYKLAAGKTAKSILISVSARMTDFYIPEIADLFADDELHLEELGKKKTAYFLIMDETKSVYNYMVAILVDTMINCMSNCAKDCPGKALPIPVRCLLDEILNIGKFPSLDRWTRTLRKYNIGLEMMIQDMAGGEDTYGEKQWSSIVGNCDTIVFLGSKEPHTIKFVSEQLLGDTTIETVSYGGNGGSGGIGNNSYSQNRQAQSRKLMDAAEVSKMGNNECLVSLRGINVFRSKKYNLKKHPNYHLLADRKSPGYTYIRDEIQLDEIQYVTMINCNTVAE
jgi:type IV secretion system protein VirD4